MPQGLEIRDANGNVIFDTFSRVGKVLGHITVNSFGTGKITIPESDFLPGSQIFTVVMPLVRQPYNSCSRITINGREITWSYLQSNNLYYWNAVQLTPHLIFYGIY